MAEHLPIFIRIFLEAVAAVVCPCVPAPRLALQESFDLLFYHVVGAELPSCPMLFQLRERMIVTGRVIISQITFRRGSPA